MKERSVFGFLYLVAVVGCLLVGRSQQVAASFTKWNQTDFDNCVVLTDSVGGTNYDYRLYWTIDPTNTTIHIGVAAKASAWLGVGISADGTMDSGGSGSDVWVGWIGGTSPACASGCVVDYWATAHEQPAKDTTGNLNTTGSEFGTIDGYTYFTYQRLLNTGDSAQDRPITPDVDQYVIHAIGPGLPTSVTDFSSAGNDGQHIGGTNAATFMKFGDAQWTCDATPTSPNGSAVNFYENPAKTWRLNWTVIDNEIEFNVSAHTTGWWALGINTEEIMVGADILWCSWQGTGGVVVDRRASAHDTPPPDSVQNVDLISYQSVDGWSTCQLRRALNTGDSVGDIAIDGSSMILLWAYGSVTSGKRSIAERDCPDFCQHASNTKGLASINFFSGATSEVATTDDKRKSHGILMLFAWGLLAVAGSFVARYCKTPQGAWVLYGYVWVHMHGLLGVLTFVLNLIAFALIVSWVSDQRIDHFKGAHEIIGLVMFICAFFQPLIGVISELFLKKYRDPNWVAYVIGVTHAWFGKALVLLGLVEIYLGLALYCVPTYAMVTYGVSIACMIALFLPHELLRWFAPWGSWLGGPGFTYQRVDDGGDTEMKDFSPDNKIPWMNKRVPRQPPLVVKICLWILQLGLAVAIIGLWIATAVGIGKKDINDSTDSYDDTCVIGTKFQ